MLCINGQKIKYQDQPDLPNAPKIADLMKLSEPPIPRYGFVYLDVWQRGITALDDSQIKESALGGADTATRTKTVWQVKVFPLMGKPTPPYSCTELFRENKVALNARTSLLDESFTNPCIIRSNAGYRRLENQLYRIEIHKSGKLGEATFKWSQDNGSLEIPVEKILERKVTVQNVGPVFIETFKGGTWVEVVDDNSELNPQGGQPRNLVQLGKDPNTASNEFSLEGDPGWTEDLKHARLRKWAGEDILVANPPATEGWIPLGDEGIEVKFSAESLDKSDEFKSGDYWLIPARIATGDIEWPKDATGKDPKPQPPLGVEHHHCKLVVITFDGSKLSLLPDSDCRIIFPPLTNIKASDVSFDKKECQLTVGGTVQSALESLCRIDVSNCELCIKPGLGWEKALDKIGISEDASICLKAGIYPLKSTVTLKNKGHIKITGSGPGTKIVIRSAEAALKFESCSSVTVRDLYAESGVAGFWHGAGLSHLNGTLTFSACPKVTVEGVMLKCAAGAERAATCLTVRDAAEYGPAGGQVKLKPVELVRINNCDLDIGYQQVGMLMINVSRAQVEGNVLNASPRPTTLSLHTLVQNYRYRSMIRHLMVHDAHFEEIDEQGELGDIIPLSVGKGKIWFKTHPLLIPVWQELFRRIPCTGVQTDRDLLLHVMNIADRALLNHGSILKGKTEIFSGFRDWYLQLEASLSDTSSQGIVVVGVPASDINIIDNKIDRVLDGIHIALTKAKTRIDASVVHVFGNNIKVSMSPNSRRRGGIFIGGGSSSLIVENNYIKVERFPVTTETEMEGIRIYGPVGDMVVVKQNHIADAAKVAKGVIFKPNKQQKGEQWIIVDNWPFDTISPV
jgi:hypothetical protein